jgi:predicted NAD-dependent protein-ADP-ribosyltransferase YbiA (DUF1768 family)
MLNQKQIEEVNMATGTGALSTQFTEQRTRVAQESLLKIHEGLALFNKAIDACKPGPSPEATTTISKQFNELATQWNELKSANSVSVQDLLISCQIIDLSMKRTEARVKKFVEKYAQNSPAQQSPSSLSLDPAQILAQRARALGYISFRDVVSIFDCASVFSNFYPCPIVYENKDYNSAEAVFKEIKSRDRRRLTLGLPRRNDDKEELDMMMDILRAKFDQNLQLKELLMATGDAHLVKYPATADGMWDGRDDGRGYDPLGVCLMRLRQEYGQKGIVEQPEPNLSMLEQDSQAPSSANDCSINSPSSSTSTSSLAGRCIQCNERPQEFLLVAGRWSDYCSYTCSRTAEFNKKLGLQGRCSQCQSISNSLSMQKTDKYCDLCLKTYPHLKDQ